MYTSKIITCIIFLVILLNTIPFTSASHHKSSKITEILQSEPSLSEFNKYLTQTELSKTINHKYWENGVTILALTNSAMLSLLTNISISGMSPLVPFPSISVMRSILSLHIIPHYYDDDILHTLQNNSTITNINNIFQDPYQPQPPISCLQIIKYKEGGVGLMSAVPGSKPVNYVKEIKTIPYNISVLQISSPIIVPALLINITTVLEKAGFNAFAKLLFTELTPETVIYDYYYKLLRYDTGITIFAPSDVALKAINLSEIKKDVLENLLALHVLDFYAPFDTLKNYKDSSEVWTDDDSMFVLNLSSSGDVVTLHTGLVDAKITSTLFDIPELIIFSIDKFLLAKEYPHNEPPPLPPSLKPTRSLPPSPNPTTAPTPTPTPAPTPANGGNGGYMTRGPWLLMATVLVFVSSFVT